MPREEFHPSDQELILMADGELPTRDTGQVRAHLAACWHCRSRMAEIEGTIADFARAIPQEIWIRLREKYQGPPLSPCSEVPRRATGGNTGLLPGEHEERPVSGAAFGSITPALPGSAMDQTVFLQWSSRMTSCRAIAGSHSGASKQDYAPRKKSSREGFAEICVIAGAGRGRETLLG